MQNAEDKPYDGIVSGVSEYGIFVEIIETKCEGMIRMADMYDDDYFFDTENYRVIGNKNKRMITLGDRVQVKIKETNIYKRTIDLVLAELATGC